MICPHLSAGFKGANINNFLLSCAGYFARMDLVGISDRNVAINRAIMQINDKNRERELVRTQSEALDARIRYCNEFFFSICFLIVVFFEMRTFLLRLYKLQLLVIEEKFFKLIFNVRKLLQTFWFR